FGVTDNRSTDNFLVYNGPVVLSVGGPWDPDLNPLGNWEAFRKAATGYLAAQQFSQHSYNRFREQSVRLAGPVFTTGGGPAPLILLAEVRQERVPEFAPLESGLVDSSPIPAERRNNTSGFYAELRTRVFGDTAPLPFLRNFELQLAIRHDRQ